MDINNNGLHYQMTQNGWVRLADTNQQHTGPFAIAGRIVLNYGAPVVAGIIVILRIAGVL